MGNTTVAPSLDNTETYNKPFDFANYELMESNNH